MSSALICDPNQSTTSTLRGVLELEGFEVFEAHNTESARYQIVMNSPDFVLIDWLEFDARNLDIENFIKQVKKIRPHTTFIFISYKGVQRDVSSFAEMVAEHGADGYILKPFNLTRVLEQLQG